jgi:membrane peptidoglycan carboxypeptidase
MNKPADTMIGTTGPGPRRRVLRLPGAGFWWRPRVRKLVLATLLVLGLALLLRWELATATLQAHVLARWASEMHYAVQPGTRPGNRYPQAGPFDERLGYTRVPLWTGRLAGRGFDAVAQAHQSEALSHFLDRGFFAPYPEKTQAGLELLDCRGDAFFQARFPQQVYPAYAAVPPLVARTLAFIENRELLAPAPPHDNPALEWKRLGRAVLDRAVLLVDGEHPASGGSTLATQLEKFRHSPQGRTASVADKYRQMVSASLRVYQDGEETGAARERILLDYLNSLPLGAQRGHGEVIGLLDGLRVWWGADAPAVNAALRAEAGDGPALAAQGRAYRQVLSLLIAQRRPSHYLGAGQQRLAALTDSYLRLLAQAGVIDPALRDAALAVRLAVDDGQDAEPPAVSAERKAASAVRIQLAALLDVPRLYDLDRLDLRVAGTLDGALQATVTDTLRELRQPEAARQAGLTGFHLLDPGDDPARLSYSFTLYESSGGVNRLRVQTDNLDQPFDINTGAKLELGSTAKLRTLITYLEIVTTLHGQLGALSPAELAARDLPRRDRLSQWAVEHLRSAPDKSLAAMLRAAMARRYSASPGESFFTGGGLHTFENFDAQDNGRRPTVAEAFLDSVNLVFIRLMRDVAHHMLYRLGRPVDALLADGAHPDRTALLARFADEEGSRFIRGFHRRHHGLPPQESLALLLSGTPATPRRLAVIYRSWAPEASFEAFSDALARHAVAGAARLSDTALRALYEQHAPGRFSLADRGYLARVHPLELWTAAYLRQHPEASASTLIAASREERQAVYSWLFRTRAKAGQDTRILSLLERDAFAEIHRAWKRLGYPFDSIVPSYASAIGSAGDRPAALAELMGIIVNDGLRLPTVQLDALHLAAGTPYETLLRRQAREGPRVMAPEVAAVVRQALTQVVEQGTARRLRGAMVGADGAALAVGGKTGTGDNRLDSYNARGAQTGSRVVNRTATFVFFAGPRHFGIVTTYVPGEAAGGYRFTSALPVQIAKHLAPLLNPVVAGVPAAACSDSQDGLQAVRK